MVNEVDQAVYNRLRDAGFSDKASVLIASGQASDLGLGGGGGNTSGGLQPFTGDPTPYAIMVGADYPSADLLGQGFEATDSDVGLFYTSNLTYQSTNAYAIPEGFSGLYALQGLFSYTADADSEAIGQDIEVDFQIGDGVVLTQHLTVGEAGTAVTVYGNAVAAVAPGMTVSVNTHPDAADTWTTYMTCNPLLM